MKLNRGSRSHYRRKHKARSYQAFLNRRVAMQNAQGKVAWRLLMGAIVLAALLCVVGCVDEGCVAFERAVTR